MTWTEFSQFRLIFPKIKVDKTINQNHFVLWIKAAAVTAFYTEQLPLPRRPPTIVCAFKSQTFQGAPNYLYWESSWIGHTHALFRKLKPLHLLPQSGKMAVICIGQILGITMVWFLPCDKISITSSSILTALSVGNPCLWVNLGNSLHVLVRMSQ